MRGRHHPIDARGGDHDSPAHELHSDVRLCDVGYRKETGKGSGGPAEAGDEAGRPGSPWCARSDPPLARASAARPSAKIIIARPTGAGAAPRRERARLQQASPAAATPRRAKRSSKAQGKVVTPARLLDTPAGTPKRCCHHQHASQPFNPWVTLQCVGTLWHAAPRALPALAGHLHSGGDRSGGLLLGQHLQQAAGRHGTSGARAQGGRARQPGRPGAGQALRCWLRSGAPRCACCAVSCCAVLRRMPHLGFPVLGQVGLQGLHILHKVCCRGGGWRGGGGGASGGWAGRQAGAQGQRPRAGRRILCQATAARCRPATHAASPQPTAGHLR